MLFRQATVEDIPELVECRKRQLVDEGQDPAIDITEPNIEYFTERFESGQMEGWVCVDETMEKGSQIIATGALIYFDFPPSFANNGGHKAYIANIYTHPDYRGRRICPQILEILENRAREKGCCRVWLEASEIGKYVYQKRGFEENEMVLMIEL